jgi:hypothetical protein
MTRPRDITDLYFAPVALGIDDEIATLDRLTHDELLDYTALVTNREPRSVSERREFLLEALTRHHDLHGWRVTWDPRGLRLAHEEHSVVLGVSPTIRSYLELPA